MKKLFHIKSSQWVLPLLLLLASCSNFLEVEPDSTRALIRTPQEVSQLLTTAYPQANYIVFSEAMSDNVEDKRVGQEDRTNRDAYRFDVITASVDQEDTPDMYWAECYRAISVANQALEIIAEADQPQEFAAQKGEALLARAYAHFMLVNFFSKFYRAGEANDSPGIPYVTESEKIVLKQYERNTVAYVYEMIEKDLLEGIPLIDDATYTVPSYHFNKAAAHAFATRFYLHKQEYEKVVQHADEVFGGSDMATYLRDWNSTYAAMSPEAIFTTYARSTERANLLLIETRSLHGRYVANYRYGLTYAKYSEIFGVSGVVNNNARFVQPLYYRGDGNYFIPKLTEYFVRASVNAEIGYPYVMLPALTAEEVLFNKVEALTLLGRNTEALAGLNTYLSKRIANYVASTHQLNAAKLRNFYGAPPTTNLLLATLDFKRAEFVQEGLRWFDLQRYELDVTHSTEGSTFTISADDPRRVLQLPQSSSLAGLTPNTR